MKFIITNIGKGTYGNNGTPFSENNFFRLDSDPIILEETESINNLTQIPNRSYTDLQNLPNLNITDWNTSFSWGNHADAGYVETVTGDLVDNTDPRNPIVNLPNNIETVSGSQQKADIAEQNAKNYVDNLGGALFFGEEFIWNTGMSQIFKLTYKVKFIFYVSVDGQIISFNGYNYNETSRNLEIIQSLSPGNVIKVTYQYVEFSEEELNSFIFTLDAKDDGLFTIGTHTGNTYNTTIDWGDGIIEDYIGTNITQITHTYNTPGIKTVTLYDSNFNGNYYMYSTFDTLNKLRTIEQWGSIKYINIGGNKGITHVNDDSYEGLTHPNFSGCTNLIYHAGFKNPLSGTRKQVFNGCTNLIEVGLINLTNTTSTEEMFQYCPNLEIVSFNEGPNLNITTAKYMFYGCSSLEVTPKLNFPNSINFMGCFGNCTNLTTVQDIVTDKATDVSRMFQACRNLTGNFPTLNLEKATNLSFMFAVAGTADLVIPNLYLPEATNCSNMFGGLWNSDFGFNGTVTGVTGIVNANFTEFCYKAQITIFPDFDAGSSTNFNSMFSQCVNLLNAPLVTTSATSNINMNYMYSNCHAILSWSENGFNTAYVSNMNNTWAGCRSLPSFESIDVSGTTELQYTWAGCWSFTTFPVIDTSHVTNFTGTWSGCTGLQSFPPNIDVSNGINFLSTWSSCSSLTSFPLLDVSNGTDFTQTWSHCSNLTSFPSLAISNGRIFQSTWSDCSNLITMPDDLDFSNATKLRHTWSRCTNMTSFPSTYDFSNVEDTLSSTWEYCSSLTSFPDYSFPKVTTFDYVFRYCTSLVTAPNIITSTTLPFQFVAVFQYCTALTEFPVIDATMCTSYEAVFRGCSQLNGKNFPQHNFITTYRINPDYNNSHYNATFSISVQSYSDLLNWLNTNNVSTSSYKNIYCGNPKYLPEAAAARASLVSKGWTIRDGGPV